MMYDTEMSQEGITRDGMHLMVLGLVADVLDRKAA